MLEINYYKPASFNLWITLIRKCVVPRVLQYWQIFPPISFYWLNKDWRKMDLPIHFKILAEPHFRKKKKKKLVWNVMHFNAKVNTKWVDLFITSLLKRKLFWCYLNSIQTQQNNFFLTVLKIEVSIIRIIDLQKLKSGWYFKTYI